MNRESYDTYMQYNTIYLQFNYLPFHFHLKDVCQTKTDIENNRYTICVKIWEEGWWNDRMKTYIDKVIILYLWESTKKKKKITFAVKSSYYNLSYTWAWNPHTIENKRHVKMNSKVTYKYQYLKKWQCKDIHVPELKM